MSVATETIIPAPRRARSFSWLRLLWVAPAAGAVAGVVNIGVYALAGAAGVDFLMPLTGGEALEPLPFVMPLVSSVVFASVAGLVLALVNFTKNSTRNFLMIAVPIGFVLSFVPLLQLPAAVTLSTKVALGLMHVVAAPIIVGALLVFAKRKQP